MQEEKQTFQIGLDISFHLLSNIAKLEPDKQEQSVYTKPLSEFHMYSLEKAYIPGRDIG